MNVKKSTTNEQETVEEVRTRTKQMLDCDEPSAFVRKPIGLVGKDWMRHRSLGCLESAWTFIFVLVLLFGFFFIRRFWLSIRFSDVKRGKRLTNQNKTRAYKGMRWCSLERTRERERKKTLAANDKVTGASVITRKQDIKLRRMNAATKGRAGIGLWRAVHFMIIEPGSA